MGLNVSVTGPQVSVGPQVGIEKENVARERIRLDLNQISDVKRHVVTKVSRR